MIDCMEKGMAQHPMQLINTSSAIGQPPSYLNSMYPNTNLPPNQQQQQAQNGNELIGYYFGSISRETAEWILRTHGDQMDGAYLLRSSGPNDDFVLSLMVAAGAGCQEVLHYKIVETEDSFVALHGQVGDEKFATIDELIDKAQGVATKPRWPIQRHALESQILPPTYWGLSVDQVRLAILVKARQWGFPLLSTLIQQQQQQVDPLSAVSSVASGVNDLPPTTLSNETIRTLIYKSLHEFQPWFHGRISREEAERRIEDEPGARDGRFLVRERDNYSYAMCISHKKTTKHYRIDVLPTGELAIQDGRKFTSLMALVSHYTIMSDGLWCALTDACARPIQSMGLNGSTAPKGFHQYNSIMNQPANLYSGVPHMQLPTGAAGHISQAPPLDSSSGGRQVVADSQAGCGHQQQQAGSNLVATSIKGPIREWLQTINHKWSQLMAAHKNGGQHQSMNSFLFGNQNPLNNHQQCKRRRHHHHLRQATTGHRERRCKNGHTSCGCIQQTVPPTGQHPPGGKVQLVACRYGQAQSRPTVVANCCAAAAPIAPQQKNVLQVNGGQQHLSSSLPQNSNFAQPLNCHSFVGSPLFAVPTTTRQPNARPARSVGSNSSDSQTSQAAGGQAAEEGKLISPVQSISGKLNLDIYGSVAASTALVNDRHQQFLGQSQPTTSGSSSLGAGPTNLAATQYGQMAADNKQPVQHAGLILCGQHAGPAFRYTNCGPNDENSLVQCLHQRRNQQPVYHQRNQRRAADDSQLVQSGAHLAAPAAMAKFVQFQDGQCLRTHRDTRSIQMAYLSSRQQPAVLRTIQPLNGPKQQQRLPPPAATNQRQSQFQSIAKNNACPNNNGEQFERPLAALGNQLLAARRHGNFVLNAGGQQSFSTLASANQNNTSVNNKCQQAADEDIDLIDCNTDYDDDFDGFRCDPKLIKSSSIETLCGIGADDADQVVDLANFKSNTELIMSQLQSCWMASEQQQQNKILSPNKIQAANQLAANPQPSAAECSLAQVNDDGFEHLKKKHDLDELTTNLLAELTASLKAQVDMKNKRAGCFAEPDANDNACPAPQEAPAASCSGRPDGISPLELVNEFDTLMIPNNSNGRGR